MTINRTFMTIYILFFLHPNILLNDRLILFCTVWMNYNRSIQYAIVLRCDISLLDFLSSMQHFVSRFIVTCLSCSCFADSDSVIFADACCYCYWESVKCLLSILPWNTTSWISIYKFSARLEVTITFCSEMVLHSTKA